MRASVLGRFAELFGCRRNQKCCLRVTCDVHVIRVKPRVTSMNYVSVCSRT